MLFLYMMTEIFELCNKIARVFNSILEKYRQHKYKYTILKLLPCEYVSLLDDAVAS